jgi:NADPH2:quinone reductase
MKAVIFDGNGDANVLTLVNEDLPEVRPTDVLVKVHTAGVNRADILQRDGVYGLRPYFGDSYVPGLEIAGEVVDAGEESTGFKRGDRVMAIVGGGGYAEYARVNYRMCMKIPTNLSFEEAAAIPEVFVTAHEALIHLGQLQSGGWALIHAAAGGVGTAAIQLAKVAGAKSVFTSSGSARIEKIKQLGGDVGVDYRHVDFLSEVQLATNGLGVDVVVDFVGAPFLENNLKALVPGGRLVQVGCMGGCEGTVPLGFLIHQYLQVIGTVMKSRTLDEKIGMTTRFAQRWLDDFATGALRPVIDQVFPLEQAAEAHRHMERSGGLGKVLLSMS